VNTRQWGREQVEQSKVDLPIRAGDQWITGTGIPNTEEDCCVTLVQVQFPEFGGTMGQWVGKDGRFRLATQHQFKAGDVAKIFQSEPFNPDKVDSEPVLVTVEA